MPKIDRDDWRKEAELTGDEHKEAEEIIGELQDRLEILKERGHAYHKKTGEGYSLKNTYAIETANGKVVITLGQGEIGITLNGSPVLHIVGPYLVGIKFDPAIRALAGVRAQMILDDLARL
jgi:hypothetical protein